MLLSQLHYKNPVISVIGLGYVGLPLAIAFAKKTLVVGFDIDKHKIECYKNGVDVTNEIGNQAIKETSVEFTTNEKTLQKCNFHIIAVPTPINKDTTPDLAPMITACEILGRNLQKHSVVVFESTVFPGATEEICIPILENTSNLKCGTDFKVGYSPERINPGDKDRNVSNIVKIVSGIDKQSLDFIAETYEMIITAGVYKANSIKVAEASKVIENTQRDVNIAFINEISIILNKMGIDTYEVLEAASTKWNFLRFSPGLVGGHCIGVDPYYLLSKSFELGYSPDLIASARKVNTNMPKYIADYIVKMLIKAGKKPLNSKVMIMGITFKENVSDIRNSGTLNIIKQLQDYGINVVVTDPLADKKLVKEAYGIELLSESSIEGVDAIVIAVAHDKYKSLDLKMLKMKFQKTPYILIDIKKIFNKKQVKKEGYLYGSL